jgi:hypothetical protein
VVNYAMPMPVEEDVGADRQIPLWEKLVSRAGFEPAAP